MRSVVITVEYAGRGIAASPSSTPHTVAGPFSHSTSINRNSASVRFDDVFRAKTAPASNELNHLYPTAHTATCQWKFYRFKTTLPRWSKVLHLFKFVAA